MYQVPGMHFTPDIDLSLSTAHFVRGLSAVPIAYSIRRTAELSGARSTAVVLLYHHVPGMGELYV